MEKHIRRSVVLVEIHWKNRIRNDEIHFKIGVAPIDENMREGRLRWFRGDD